MIDADSVLPLCLQSLRRSVERLYDVLVRTPFPDIEPRPETNLESMERFRVALQWFEGVKLAYGNVQVEGAANEIQEGSHDCQTVLSHFADPQARARLRLEILEGDIRFEKNHSIRAAAPTGMLLGHAELRRITKHWLVALHPDSRQPQLITAETILGPLPLRFATLPLDRAKHLTFASFRDRGDLNPVMSRSDGDEADRFLGQPDRFNDDAKALMRQQGIELNPSLDAPIEFTPDEWRDKAGGLHEVRRVIYATALALVQWIQNGLAEIENAITPMVELPRRSARRTARARIRMAGTERSVELQSKQVEFLAKLAKNHSATTVRATFNDLIRQRIPELAPYITAIRRSPTPQRENESTYQLSPTMKNRLKLGRERD